jgi:hypothetical protein
MEQKLLDDWVQNEWLPCMIPYLIKHNFYKNNPYLSLKLIENNMDLQWSWNNLSELPFITATFAFAHHSKSWNWAKIIRKPDFTMKLLNDTNKQMWNYLDWRFIYNGCEIDMEFVNTHMGFIETISNIQWFWYYLSQNRKFVTLNNLLKYPDKPWRWDVICKMQDIQMDVVLHFSDKPWHYSAFVYNPNLSLEAVVKYATIIKPQLYGSADSHIFKNDADNYISSRKIRLSLASILEFYETAKQSQLSTIHDGDFIFSNNYLVKNIMNFL